MGLQNVQAPKYVICYGEFEGVVEITKNREVLIG